MGMPLRFLVLGEGDGFGVDGALGGRRGIDVEINFFLGDSV